MGLSSYTGGGGKKFLPSGDVQEGDIGKILEQPAMVEKDFGDGPKTVPAFQMEVETLENDEGGHEFEWTPGKFAVGHLLETLGPDEAKWDYPIDGSFVRVKKKTRFGPKEILFFVAAGTPAPVSDVASSRTPKATSGSDRGTRASPTTDRQQKPTKEAPREKKTFTCKFPTGTSGRPCGQHFSTADALAAHMETH